MKVRFKDNVERIFTFKEGDYVTIVLNYLTAKTEEDELYYHGTITNVDIDGIWCVLDDDKTREEYLAFADIENIVSNDKEGRS